MVDTGGWAILEHWWAIWPTSLHVRGGPEPWPATVGYRQVTGICVGVTALPYDQVSDDDDWRS